MPVDVSFLLVQLFVLLSLTFFLPFLIILFLLLSHYHSPRSCSSPPPFPPIHSPPPPPLSLLLHLISSFSYSTSTSTTSLPPLSFPQSLIPLTSSAPSPFWSHHLFVLIESFCSSFDRYILFADKFFACSLDGALTLRLRMRQSVRPSDAFSIIRFPRSAYRSTTWTADPG